jgi:hypothetical protein
MVVISARTGRIGLDSTTGLARVPAARLALAQLDQGVGHSHPQLDAERGVEAGPVGEHSLRAWPWRLPLIMLCHDTNTTLSKTFGRDGLRHETPPAAFHNSVTVSSPKKAK